MSTNGRWEAGVLAIVAAVMAAGCASAVKAERIRIEQPMDFHHGTTLALAAGASSAASDARLMGGGSIGWEITRRVGLEANGSWLDRGPGAGAFTASLAAQVNLLPTRAWSPFVEAGMGMYRASFDPSRSTIPTFYAKRMTLTDLDANSIAFRDPAFVFGAGVNLFAIGHLAFRPAIDSWLVTSGHSAQEVAAFSVKAVYHFEDHLGR